MNITHIALKDFSFSSRVFFSWSLSWPEESKILSICSENIFAYFHKENVGHMPRCTKEDVQMWDAWDFANLCSDLKLAFCGCYSCGELLSKFFEFCIVSSVEFFHLGKLTANENCTDYWAGVWFARVWLQIDTRQGCDEQSAFVIGSANCPITCKCLITITVIRGLSMNQILH